MKLNDPKHPENETLEVNGAEFLLLCDRVKAEGRYIAVVRVERPGVYRCDIRTLKKPVDKP